MIITLSGATSFSAAGVLRHRTRHGAISFFGVEITRISARDRETLCADVAARNAEESALEESKRRG